MQTKQTSWQTFKTVLQLDWRAHLRAGQTCWLPAGFLLLIACLWPLALPAELSLHQKIGPGMVWVATLLAVVLLLDKLFNADFIDHAITHWHHSPYSIMIFIYCRLLTVSALFLLAVLSLTPIFLLLYQLSINTILHLMITFALGIPSLIAIGAVVSALLIGVGSRTMLLPLLIIPLWLPVLIFSTSSIYQQMLGLPTAGHIALLAAILLTTFTLAPWGVKAALTMGLE